MTVQLEFRLNGEVPVRLFTIKARKFFGLAVVLFFTIPFGLSVTGCGHKTAAVVYCNGHDTGPVVGALATIQLEPSLAIVGESLNYGQIGSALSASGLDCKGNAVSLTHINYGTSDPLLADVNPSTGQACGGTFNRNTPGGVPDYTTCNAPATKPSNYLAYITATSDGIASNALPVYVHPTATSVGFGAGNCSTDPDTTCCPTSPTTVITNAPAYSGTACLSQGKIGQIAARIVSNTAPVTYSAIGATVSANSTTIAVLGASAPPAQRVATLSGFTGSLAGLNGQSYVVMSNQPNLLNTDPGGNAYAYSTFTLATNFGVAPANVTPTFTAPVPPAKTYTVNTIGSATTTNNITCNAGHITWGTEGAAGIVSIDQNGVVTANQPGSVAITGNLSNSSSSSTVGFFSTCPPVSISLQPVGNPTATSITVPLHNSQPITAIVKDQSGAPITGLNLEYNSTTPITIPGGSTVQPVFPGTAVITAVCQPSVCNPAPYSQIGYLGNGKPITSNGITVTATGTSSTLLYIASTNSQYVLPIDFTTSTNVAAVKLPYVPNSMVLTQDGSRLYFGSPQGLMNISTANNSVGSVNTLVPGTVISVSPSSDEIVVTDPTRQTISLVASGGSSVSTTYGGVATHASWSPDGQTVYITTTGNNILVYSNYTNWQSTMVSQGGTNATYKDVAVLQPSVGAYFAGNNNAVDGRSYCPLSQNIGGGTPPTENNTFAPLAGSNAATVDRIATTTDGLHVLGASVATGVTDIFLTSTPSNCTYVDNVTERTPVTFVGTNRSVSFAGVIPSLITGVLPSSNSAIAFVTYTGTGGKIPYYLPVNTGNTGTLNYFPLTGATAPVAGVFSSDDSTFFVGTSGDNKVHLLTITYPTSGAPVITDSSQITPALPDPTGTTTAVPNLIAQHPKASKS